MKIIIVNETYLTHWNLLMALFIIFLLLGEIIAECKIEHGCMPLENFMVYTKIKEEEMSSPLETIYDYKMIYIFNNRLVFLTDTNSSLESKNPKNRVINFEDIILDCGQYHNKLCHALEYPGSEKIESISNIQTIRQIDADVLCLIITFFEISYNTFHENSIYLCGRHSNDLFAVINFKNYVSRKIESYQLTINSDRYSRFKQLFEMERFFIESEGKKLPIKGKVFSDGITFLLKDEKKMIKYDSVSQQNIDNPGIYFISENLENSNASLQMIEGWNTTDCCISLNKKSKVCLANLRSDNFEPFLSDGCKMKGRIFSELFHSLKRIKFTEASNKFFDNKLKLTDCNSLEYKIIRSRLEKTILYAIDVDCKIIMNYINENDEISKRKFCYTNYKNELQLELKLISFDNEQIFNEMHKCVYKSSDFSEILNESHFNELMTKRNLLTRNIFNSFLELSFKETQFLDSREDERYSNFNTNSLGVNKERVNFNEINSGQDNKSTTPKESNDYTYSKPDELTESEVNNIKNFRISQMKELQSRKYWKTAVRESINENFNKHSSAFGKNNIDEFVSFFGFLSDASLRSSRDIVANEYKNLRKLTKSS